MSRRSRFLILISVFCLAPGWRHAQNDASGNKRGASTTHADDRGLLLGLYFPDRASWDNLSNRAHGEEWVPDISSQPHGRYVTFWISRTPDAVKIRATEGLLVPRADGFWHVGTHVVRSDQDPDSSYDEQFWAVPTGEKPKSPEADPQIDGASVRLITYAGPEYVAYLFHWQGGAGAWEYVYPHVVSLQDLATETSLEKVLGPAAAAEYKRLAKSLDHMKDEPKEGEDREPCNCCTSVENEWGILHVEDSWQAYARFHYGPSSSCSQGWEDRVLKATIPRSVAPGGILNRSWDVLRTEAETVSKSEQGSVRHLFVSPKQDIAVAVGTNGLTVLGVENLHMVSVLKKQKFEAACIPVMEQWSMGRFVARWDAAIQKEHSAEMPRGEEP